MTLLVSNPQRGDDHHVANQHRGQGQWPITKFVQQVDRLSGRLWAVGDVIERGEGDR